MKQEVNSGQTLIAELKDRGLVHQKTSELETIFEEGVRRTAYLGVDPTADSMHVGNLVTFITLIHLLRNGHKIIFLTGGATGLIGDPSGKDKERDFVDNTVVAARAKRIEKQIRTLTKRMVPGAKHNISFTNNLKWFRRLTALDFLRDVGKHFTVNAMIKKDSVSARLESEQGISFTEFSYALLQSYDFYHLAEKNHCDLQIGGADQWGNISSGVDFVRRKTGKLVFGFTQPLITDSATGKKFGKSAGNAVWLDAEKTSPYDFYQFWLNVSDDDSIKYLKTFTFIPLEDIERIKDAHTQNPAARVAQKKLAYEVTALIHGEREADRVQDAVPKIEISDQVNIRDELVRLGIVESKSALTRLEASGAISSTVTHSTYERLSNETLPDDDTLRIGKRRFVRIIKKK